MPAVSTPKLLGKILRVADAVAWNDDEALAPYHSNSELKPLNPNLERLLFEQGQLLGPNQDQIRLRLQLSVPQIGHL